MKTQGKNTLCLTLSLLSNLLLVGLGSAALIRMFFFSDNGVGALRFFTNDGNVFAVLASVAMAATEVRVCFGKAKSIPLAVHLAKAAAAVTEAIIFLVVMVLLVPLSGFGLLSGFDLLVLHVIDPLLCVLSFLAWERSERKLSVATASFGALPVVVYGAAAVFFVLTGFWEDEEIPYPFLRVYDNPVWQSLLYFAGILGAAWALSIVFEKINGSLSWRFSRRH
jgi:hypothetical protein